MRRSAVAVLLWLASMSAANAWGAQGHRVTGHIANVYLTDTTRAQLTDLLGHDDLVQVATWMDDVRDILAERLPGSPRWHYENRAACDPSRRACDGGHCVTSQIEHYRAVLQDSRQSREQRAEAVRVLVHLIGDLHQPLHLADNADRGGNEAYALLPGEREARRLHEVWDTQLLRLKMNRRSAASYARTLDAQHHATSMPTTVSIESWAVETHKLGTSAAYGALPGFACGARSGTQSKPVRLDEAYVTSAKIVVDEQLWLAGRRIALVLNAAFGD